MIRKLSLLAVALAVAAAASTARAVPVEVVFAPSEPTADTPEGLFPWSLSLNLEEGVAVVGINVVVIGFDSMQLDAENPGISPLDSAFVSGVFGDDRAALLIQSPDFNNVSLGAGAGVLLATLYSPVDCIASPETCPVRILDHPEYFGGTVFGPGAAGITVITEYLVLASPGAWVTGDAAYPDLGSGGGTGGGGSGGGGSGGGGTGGGGTGGGGSGDGGDPGLPEPSSLVLLSLVLLSLAFRRSSRVHPG